MIDIVLLLAVLATLLVVVAVSQPVAVRLKVAPVVLLAVIGVAIGALSGVLLHTTLTNRFDSIAALFVDLPVGAETFIYVFLPLLVFEAAQRLVAVFVEGMVAARLRLVAGPLLRGIAPLVGGRAHAVDPFLHALDAARSRAAAAAVNGAWWLAAVMTLQATLGILTLLNEVPIVLALAHQAVAIAVLTLAIFQAERLAGRRPASAQQELVLPVTQTG